MKTLTAHDIRMMLSDLDGAIECIRDEAPKTAAACISRVKDRLLQASLNDVDVEPGRIEASHELL